MKNVTLFVTSVFTPNKTVSSMYRMIILTLWIVVTVLYWSTSSSAFLPHISNIISAAVDLFQTNGLAGALLSSIWLCAKAMFWAVFISALVGFISVMPFFRPFSEFVGKMRFMTTIGLTFLFALMFPSTESQKLALLVFGITVFQATSFTAIIAGVTKAELDYARTLKMNEWEAVWHVMIVGKRDMYLESIRQNFAIAWMMLAMVENLCRSEGGIGVILNDQNRVFHLDAVYSIQIMILILGMLFDYVLELIRKMTCPYSYLTLERK